jgi:hypothetical protein
MSVLCDAPAAGDVTSYPATKKRQLLVLDLAFLYVSTIDLPLSPTTLLPQCLLVSSVGAIDDVLSSFALFSMAIRTHRPLKFYFWTLDIPQ